MYRHIYVPVDNSEHSSAAVDLAVTLGRALGARLTGCHVYAAGLHAWRFRQMEYTLPERYREEGELERQREVHGGLIAMGLRLISDSYLDAAGRKAATAGVPFERKTFDGQHWRVLVRDVASSDYDLVVMGALGMGAVKDSQLGSVTERFVRKATTDTLVVRHAAAAAPRAGAIVAALDGSPQSFHGLRLALGLGRALGRSVEAVAVYDPYLHYALFKSLLGVLSAEAAQVFRFKEQERLHEEIIDSGLARIYQSHLDIARTLARQEGVELGTRLLAGKCFEKLLHHCRSAEPWLLVLGRTGIHSEEGDTELGSNAENLLRLAPSNVLLTGGRFSPPPDLQARETVSWTREALARMERVPAHVRGLARAALVRFAVEQGHTVITSGVIDEVMARLMPGRPAERIQALALSVAVERLEAEGRAETAICSGCGYAAQGPGPAARCPVCGHGAEGFRVVDRAALEAAAARQGGIVEEEVLPGITIRWAAEALAALGGLGDPALRRQVKARIEKHARSRRLSVVTRELALEVLGHPLGPEAGGDGRAALPWSGEAEARLGRVPAGFMREMTRAEIERAARARGAAAVSLDLCEAVIARLRSTMCPPGTEG